MRIRDNDERLTPEEEEEFQKALLDAFRLDSFDMMLSRKLGWSYQNITTRSGFEFIVLDTIRYTEDRSESRELLLKACEERPKNKQLWNFARKFHLAPPESTPPAEPSPEERLERRIRELNSYLDVVQWRKRLERLERQICHIVVRLSNTSIAEGSGFLIGPDIIMTNYHVVKEVLQGKRASNKVTCYFDYKLQDDGKTPQMGPAHVLAEDWLIDHSRYSHQDLQSHPHPPDVEPDELDYVLLRLNDRPGEEVIASTGSADDGEETRRGWIEISEETHDLIPEKALFILHHPCGDPLKLALDTQGIQEVNGAQTRLYYYTNTENGSSGAPCFDANWNLIALHQSGDPNFHRSAEYNQGIPFATIWRLLEMRGKKWLFNGKKKQ